MQAITKAKKVGGSIVVVIPKEIVEKERIQVDDTLKIKVERKDSLNSLWGILKDTKIPAQKIMDIINEGEDIG